MIADRKVWASVVSDGDAPPILDPAEHVLDAIALLVEDVVVVGRFFRFLRCGMQGERPFLAIRCGTSRRRINIRQQFLGFGQAVEQMPDTLTVAGLARGEEKQQRSAQPIDDGVQLGVQAAFCSSDAAGKSPLLSRLAAVRWAFRWVASIISLSGWPALPARALKIRLKTPNSLHRMKRL